MIRSLEKGVIWIYNDAAMRLRPIEAPTPEELRLLRVIDEQSVTYAKEAGERIGVCNSRVGPLVARLKRKGLIEPCGDSTGAPGRHRVYIRVTQAGKCALRVMDSGRPYKIVRALKTED